MRLDPIRRFLLSSCMAVGLVMSAPSGAHAQITVVAQADRASDISGQAAMGIGGGVRFPLAAWNQNKGMTGVITFSWFFPDDSLVGANTFKRTYAEVNMNGILDVKGAKGLYVGTGLNFSILTVNRGTLASSGGSELGLNAIAGFHVGGVRRGTFVQARYEVGGGKQLVLTGGIHFWWGSNRVFSTDDGTDE